MLSKRILSSVVGIVLFAGAILWGKEASSLVIAILILIGTHEMNRALETAGYKPMKVLSYLSVAVIPLMACDPLKTDFYIVLVLSMALFVSMSLAVLNKKYRIIDAWVTMMGILYITGMFTFVLRTRLAEGGKLFVWLIFFGAWGTDTFAYFAGRLFGKRKIIPSVSPGKTVEGSIAGVIGGIVFSAVYGVLSGINIWHSAGAGLLAGVVSQIGDWIASAIKRFAGIKDYGRILPGHGGILDRFDSILFTAPVLYYYFVLVIGL